MEEWDKINSNVRKMIDAGAPTQDIDAYLGHMGTSADGLKQYNTVTRLKAKVPEHDRAGAKDTILQSATFNTLDELSGAVTAPFSVAKRAWTGEDAGKPLGQRFKDAYSAERDYQRDRLDLYRRENPGKAVAADVAGAFVTANPGAGAAAVSRGLGTNIARGVGIGAAQGAASSAGAAQGGMDNRIAAATQGALLGGAVGGAVPLAMGVGGAIGRGASDAVRGRTNPSGYAAQKVSERFADAGVDPGAIATRMERAQGLTGQRMAPVDFGGDTARDLLRTSSNLPGPARNQIDRAMTTRAMSQGDRVKRIVKSVFQDPDGYGQMTDDILTARQSAAEPYYKIAYDNPVTFTESLEGILKRPSGRAALARANKIAADEGVPFQQWFGRVDEAGNLADVKRVPDMRAWDYIKRGLDGMIDEAMTPADAFGRRMHTDSSRAIQKLKNTMLGEIDSMNPAWAQARKVGMDNIEMSDALELGRKAYTMTPEQVRRALKDMTEGQREVAQVGFAEAMRDKVDSAGYTNDVVKRIFGTREQADITKAMFGDNTTAYAQFREAMLNEARMRKTYDRVRGNSTTARQLADMAESRGTRELGEFGANAVTGGPVAATAQWIGSRLRMLGGLTPESANEIQRLLLNRNPDQVRAIAQQLQSIQQRARSRQEAAVAVRNLISRIGAMQADQTLPQDVRK